MLSSMFKLYSKCYHTGSLSTTYYMSHLKTMDVAVCIVLFFKICYIAYCIACNIIQNRAGVLGVHALGKKRPRLKLTDNNMDDLDFESLITLLYNIVSMTPNFL